MAVEEIQQLFAQFKDYMQGSNFYAPIIINLNSGNAENNLHGNEVDATRAEQKPEQCIEVEDMKEGAKLVRPLFWSDSSMAVIFCVCRDCFNYADNMSQFERDFNCTDGLLSNTFRNNPYMRLPVEKWEQNGAKERVLRLVDEYKNAVKTMVQK